MTMKHPSRRSFLKGVAAVSGAACISHRSWSAISPNSPHPADAVPTKLTQFDYADVKLLDGPMLEQFNTNHAFFLALDEDALLKPFRESAGLPTPGEDMGGWYSWSK